MPKIRFELTTVLTILIRTKDKLKFEPMQRPNLLAQSVIIPTLTCFLGIWAPEPNYTCYIGLRLQCRTEIDVFPPGLFQRLQIRLRRIFKEDFEDQELTIWSEGLICCRGEVQVRTELTDLDRAIHICVRGAEHTKTECLALIRQFYEVISHALQDICPGTETVTQVLSAPSLLYYALRHYAC